MTQVNGERNPTADFGPGHPFTGAEIISSYSRAQAIEDGFLVDVSAMAREAGIKYPTAITMGVWGDVVNPSETAKANGESESGRLWDVLQMLRFAVIAKRKQAELKVGDNGSPEDAIWYEVSATDERGFAVTHKLWSKCGPGDTAEPVITIMLTSED